MSGQDERHKTRTIDAWDIAVVYDIPPWMLDKRYDTSKARRRWRLLRWKNKLRTAWRWLTRGWL